MDMQVYLGNAKGHDTVRPDHRQFVCGKGDRQPQMNWGSVNGVKLLQRATAKRLRPQLRSSSEHCRKEL